MSQPRKLRRLPPLWRAFRQPPDDRLARVERPDSASSMTAAAANCLLTEHSWNRVPGVNGTPALHVGQVPARSA